MALAFRLAKSEPAHPTSQSAARRRARVTSFLPILLKAFRFSMISKESTFKVISLAQMLRDTSLSAGSALAFPSTRLRREQRRLAGRRQPLAISFRGMKAALKRIPSALALRFRATTLAPTSRATPLFPIHLAECLFRPTIPPSEELPPAPAM